MSPKKPPLPYENPQLSALSMSQVGIMGRPPSLGATGSSMSVSHQQLRCVSMTFPNLNWKWNRQLVIGKIEESEERRPEIEPPKPPLPYENPQLSWHHSHPRHHSYPCTSFGLTGLRCPPGSGCRFLLTVVVLKRDVN